MLLPEVSGTETTPLVRSRWLAPGVMETSLVGATLKGSCVPTRESIQLEGCRPQPKRSRRCWRRLGGCWMLSGCLRQPGFGSPSPPHGGPERPRVGKCHRGANENVIWSQGCRRGCQLLDRDLSCRLGAQVRGKEAKLNRATLRHALEIWKPKMRSWLQICKMGACASRETLCWLLKGREPLLVVPSHLTCLAGLAPLRDPMEMVGSSPCPFCPRGS